MKPAIENEPRGLSLGKFAEYLHIRRIPKSRWEEYKVLWAKLNNEEIPSNKILIDLQYMGSENEKLKGLSYWGFVKYLIAYRVPINKLEKYSELWIQLNREKTFDKQFLMAHVSNLKKWLYKELRGLSVKDFAKYLIMNSVPKNQIEIYNKIWAQVNNEEEYLEENLLNLMNKLNKKGSEDANTDRE